jgi:hypothetical protein
MERVRYCIDQTTLRPQLQLIYGTTSVPRILRDILIFLCSVLFPACALGDRSNSIKPVTNTPPQPHNLVSPDFFMSLGRRLFWGEQKVCGARRVPIVNLGSSNDDTRLYESNCRCFKFTFHLALSKMPNLGLDLSLKRRITQQLFHRPVQRIGPEVNLDHHNQ